MFDWLRRRKKSKKKEDTVLRRHKVADEEELAADAVRKLEKDAEQREADEPFSGQVPFFNPFGRIADAVLTQITERERAYEERSQAEIRQQLENIAVISFVGQSGSGKSTAAIRIAREYRIEYIIDDGLLIHGSSIVAGTSAKRAETKIESVRRAIFDDPTRSENMRRALSEHMPPALMIIGTSDAMLEKICNNLWLNQPAIKLRIEDVTTEEERNQARQTRLSEGKHTIPVPSMEIKHDFSGYFTEPLQKLIRRFDRSQTYTSTESDQERTVVRPTFSTLGNFSISDEAMRDLISLLALRIEGVEQVVDTKIRKESYGIIISLDLSIFYGSSTQEILAQVQAAVSGGVEFYTSINVLAINVRAMRVAKKRSKESIDAMKAKLLYEPGGL
ncbi:MAG TPA: hypothetical protein VFC89_03655 [Oscillospiraceae bacterium]|jgi:uncharacterized alkaline shock family protein YloU|nr:hypothetical protein [Oscillospiraceae bacterium]